MPPKPKCMSRKSRRTRFTRTKRKGEHTRLSASASSCEQSNSEKVLMQSTNSGCDPVSMEGPASGDSSDNEAPMQSTNSGCESGSVEVRPTPGYCHELTTSTPGTEALDNDHDYSRLKYQQNARVSESDGTRSSSVPLHREIPTALLTEVRRKVLVFLHQHWIALQQKDSICVFLVSPENNLAIQRNIVFFFDGNIELYIHCEKVDVEPFMTDSGPFLPLQSDTINSFVDRAVTVVNNVRCMQVCSGYDDAQFQSVWSSCPFGIVDNNPYRECRYVETFRSLSCLRLVSSNKWRCSECAKLYKPLKRRAIQAAVKDPDIRTANKNLTEEQRLKKLEEQRRQLENAKRKISRLQTRMQEVIQKCGVQIEDSLSDDLSEILESSTLSPAQSIFLQQQIKASQKKNMCGMRWHPTMIRLALSIHLTSPSAYELMRDTGMIKLPSSRTLFDYAHIKPLQEGIDEVVLNSLGERMKNFTKVYQRYHVLMADEMHISQNLVFHKTSGKLIGYTSLNKIDEEVNNFQQYLDNPETELEPTIATKVLTYMVKGIANGVKAVVATFAVASVSVSQMYDWTWRVIRALESSKVAVLAFVCDGCSTNRAFIKRHIPVTVVSSGVVFDTVNTAAANRILYFLSDVPHLLKTIRNCFMNSRSDMKKSRRKMKKNGKKILWDFIIKLYNCNKDKTLRKSFKLNVMNVFPDSYARMKVKYAAEVLSRTVAQHLEDRGWEEATETIAFIRLVNDWFDCLNGAHTSIGKRRRNPRLEPYTSKEDDRFAFLEKVLDYFDEWKRESDVIDVTLNTTVEVTDAGNQNPIREESILEEEDMDAEAETPASKRILSKQTLEGIEITTRAVIPLVKFLLDEGTQFVNARIFTQDPLEQHFSRVRAGQGGSTNPNLCQVLNRNRALHTIGQLGMKRRKGNVTEQGDSSVEVTTEPLPKRVCERKSIISTSA